MKRTNRIVSFIMTMGLVLSMLLFLRMDVDAAYDYTVKFVIGGTGAEKAKFVLEPSALTLISDTAEATISEDGTELIVTGLQYNDEIVFDPKLGVSISSEAGANSKYCVKGIRRSGSDDWVAKSAFKVQKDDSYVIAYGVGTIVEYTVKYLDEVENELSPMVTYYGLLGEEVYIPYRYIDGYAPNTYNIDVLSLGENQEFTFIYKKVNPPAGTTTYESSTRTEYATVTGEPQYIYQMIPRQVIPETAVPAAGGQNGNTADIQGEDAGEEGDGVVIDDERAPLGIDDIVTIGDKPTPRSISSVYYYSRFLGFAIIIVAIGMIGLLISTFVTFKGPKDE